MEKSLLDTALQKLNELPSIQCYELPCEMPLDDRILIKKGEYERAYYYELRGKIVPVQVPALKAQLEVATPYILIAGYITPEAKKLLRQEQIPYLDTAGNMFLDDKGLYIFIETNQSNRSTLSEHDDAFSVAGLKVVFQFLIHPESLNKPYRFIGEQASVTIHTVGRVFHGLLAEKYIVRADAKTYQFADRKKLFEDWVTAFNKKLRPKLKQTKYQWLDKTQNWKTVELPEHTLWGGAMAADTLTNYLIADKELIYTDLPFQELARTLKIIPNAKGPLMLVEKFWKGDENGKTVHPMLVYADLIHDGHPRYIEAAQLIYKKYVENKL